MRTPTFADLRRFCREDHWEEKRRTDHWRYTKRLPDGTTARTKVSFGSGQIGDPDLFAAILRDQLHVSRDEFWRVVDHGGPAPRPAAAPEIAPAAELPACLWQRLLNAGASREQISGLTSVDAKRLLDELQSRPPDQ